MSEVIINFNIGQERWDAYLNQQAGASFCHLYNWKEVFEESFGHRCFYLAAEVDGRVAGLLPLCEIKSRFFGRALVSLPFLDYGGICTDETFAAGVLLNKAQEIVRNNDLDYLELRHKGLGLRELMSRAGKVNLRLDLSLGPDALWRGLNAKVRNQVRKAEKEGLSFSAVGQEGLGSFYSVFSRNMRDLGTPVYAKDFFMNILSQFPGQTELLLVNYKGSAIGAALAVYFKDQMEIPWASSLRKYFRLCPNNLLYWEAIKQACAKGCRSFSFGRSTIGSSHYNFKKQWGARDEALAYQFYSFRPDSLPDLSPRSPKYRAAVNVWKKMPLSLAEKIGPKISRYIP